MTDDEIARFFQSQVRTCRRCGAPFRLGPPARGRILNFCSVTCRKAQIREQQHVSQVRAVRRIRASVETNIQGKGRNDGHD